MCRMQHSEHTKYLRSNKSDRCWDVGSSKSQSPMYELVEVVGVGCMVYVVGMEIRIWVCLRKIDVMYTCCSC